MAASVDEPAEDKSASPKSFPSLNYVAAVLEEIALEGLDGITFEAAAKRLRRRWGAGSEGKGVAAVCDDRLAALVWSVARKQRGVRVYQLVRNLQSSFTTSNLILLQRF